MQAELRGKERRNRTLSGRAMRMSYPLRKSYDELLGGLPCSVLGHKWTEIPGSLRSARSRTSKQMEYQCRVCSAHAGFH